MDRIYVLNDFQFPLKQEMLDREIRCPKYFTLSQVVAKVYNLLTA